MTALEDAVRQEVIRELQGSPVTGPLFHEAEKVLRPVVGKATGRAYLEAVICEAGLGDIYADAVKRRLRQARIADGGR